MEKRLERQGEKQGKALTFRRVCNLCKQKYVAHSKFERFCRDCKEASELYHFHDWFKAS